MSISCEYNHVHGHGNTYPERIGKAMISYPTTTSTDIRASPGEGVSRNQLFDALSANQDHIVLCVLSFIGIYDPPRIHTLWISTHSVPKTAKSSSPSLSPFLTGGMRQRQTTLSKCRINSSPRLIGRVRFIRRLGATKELVQQSPVTMHIP